MRSVPDGQAVLGDQLDSNVCGVGTVAAAVAAGSRRAASKLAMRDGDVGEARVVDRGPVCRCARRNRSNVPRSAGWPLTTTALAVGRGQHEVVAGAKLRIHSGSIVAVPQLVVRCSLT